MYFYSEIFDKDVICLVDKIKENNNNFTKRMEIVHQLLKNKFSYKIDKNETREAKVHLNTE